MVFSSDVGKNVSVWAKLEEAKVDDWNEFSELFSRQVTERKPKAKVENKKVKKVSLAGKCLLVRCCPVFAYSRFRFVGRCQATGAEEVAKSRNLDI